jgi:hypothetical protein
VFWYTGGPAPITCGGDSGLWVSSAATGNLPTWSNLVPNTVQVQGDLALIYFEVLWTINTPDGQALQNPSRRMLVMRRVDGRWLVAGGTVAGIPQPADGQSPRRATTELLRVPPAGRHRVGGVRNVRIPGSGH